MSYRIATARWPGGGEVVLIDRTPIDPKFGFMIRSYSKDGSELIEERNFSTERAARESRFWPIDERQCLSVTKPRQVPISCLLLGDFVSVFDGPYNWGTVTDVNPDEVEITRPYLHIADFATVSKNSGERVIAYTGLEKITLDRSSEREVNWLPRNVVPS